MFTAKLLGCIEFSSYTEIPETATTPETALIEFIVRVKSDSPKVTKNTWVTCRLEGKNILPLLDPLFAGAEVFVEGSLEMVPFIDSETNQARTHTILYVERLGFPKLQAPPKAGK